MFEEIGSELKTGNFPVLEVITVVPLEILGRVETTGRLDEATRRQSLVTIKALPIPVVLGVQILGTTRGTLHMREEWLGVRKANICLHAGLSSVSFGIHAVNQCTELRIGPFLAEESSAVEARTREYFEELIKENDTIFALDREQLGRTSMV